MCTASLRCWGSSASWCSYRLLLHHSTWSLTLIITDKHIYYLLQVILPVHPAETSSKRGVVGLRGAWEKVKEHQSIRKKLTLTYRVYHLSVCDILMEVTLKTKKKTKKNTCGEWTRFLSLEMVPVPLSRHHTQYKYRLQLVVHVHLFVKQVTDRTSKPRFEL